MDNDIKLVPTFMNLLSNTHGQQPSIVHQQRFEAGCQRGSIAIMAAICLSIMVILLSSIDIGYLFYMKRDLQKVADLAALAGAQQLVSTPPADPTKCVGTDKVVQAANGNAQANGFSTAAPNVPIVTCGRWDPTTNPAPNYFLAPPAGNTPLNAVQVILTQTVPAFFGLSSRTISAQAIASGSNPYAIFSIGTGLLSVCGGSLLAPLLQNLLGSSVCLQAMTYNGLLGAQVSLLNVLTNLNLNVGDLDSVLNTQISLTKLINAFISAMSSDQLASIQVNDLLSIASSPLGDKPLTIGKILNVNAADGVAALNTQINLLDLLNVATFQVANKKNFAVADVGVDLGPIGKVGLNLALIDPPQMAVGGVGGTGGLGATAKSAQLRLKVVINALTLAPGYSAVNVPLYVDLAPGKATLNTLQCNAPQSATFSVTTGVAEICMANGQGADTPLSCPDVSVAANRVDVIPGVLNLGIFAHLTSSQQTITMNAPLPASQTVDSSFASMLGSLIQKSLIGAGLDVLPGLPDWLLTAVLSGVGGLLSPILTGVGSLLDAMSPLLGLHVGQSTVNLYSINCGSVKLVY